MKSKNTNLHSAKKAKNDEFYTQLSDIEKELGHYGRHFRGKMVLCNCDDPAESNFWRYFALNFKKLGLKRLVATHFEKTRPSYMIEADGSDINKDGKIDWNDLVRTPLEQNGDFRSPECVALLDDADIVVTNPPFSLFREYINQLVEHKKKFLVIGNMNAITYKEIFKYIKEDKMWLGITSPKEFKIPSGEIQKFGNICWFTNLVHKHRNEPLILYKTYKGNEKAYPKYDNYDAINVDKVCDIPVDYTGPVGVPITFLTKYNPTQFEILGLGISNSGIEMGVRPYKEDHKKYRKEIQKRGAVDGDLYMINKNIVDVPYARIIIKRKVKI